MKMYILDEWLVLICSAFAGGGRWVELMPNTHAEDFIRNHDSVIHCVERLLPRTRFTNMRDAFIAELINIKLARHLL